MKATHNNGQDLDIPVGSIYFDDLIQRYLVGIGLREFGFLTREEITQFAFLAVLRVTQKYEMLGADKENFWNWVMPNYRMAHICLLPDTTEGRDYLHRSGELTILFKDVDNVRALMRRVFLNLVIEEIRNEKSQQRIKGVAEWNNLPSRRRRVTKGESYQSLEAYARDLYDQRKKADTEAVKQVIETVLQSLNTQHQDVISLILNENYTIREVSLWKGMSVDNVYKIKTRFFDKCRETWNKVTTSSLDPTLSSYLNSIRELPDFREDPVVTSFLVKKMKSGDKAASSALMESTLKYIARLVAAHCRSWNAWKNYDDLLQEANVKVATNIERYEPSKSSLEHFIRYRVRFACVDFWYKSNMLSIKDYERRKIKILQRMRSDLSLTLGREPTIEELSEHLGMDEDEVRAIQEHSSFMIAGISGDDEDKTGRKVFNLDSLVSAELDPLRHIEVTELQETIVTCLGNKDANLLLAYFESGVEGFRKLYFQINGREITKAAARKAKERLLTKLKKHLQGKGKVLFTSVLNA